METRAGIHGRKLPEQITTAPPCSSEPTTLQAPTDNEEIYHIVTSHSVQPVGKRPKKKTQTTLNDDDEPLVDTTAALQLHSKKTERMQKRLEKKSKKKPAPKPQSFLDLPSELLLDTLTYLRPSDLSRLQRVNRTTKSFIQENEATISREIIRVRYSILAQCFPLPLAFSTLDTKYHSALLSSKRQDLLAIHKKPYQHVKPLDPLDICTCMTCVFAWNNLCTIVDLAHWQKALDSREPIPMIPRGQNPDWNQDLIAHNATLVQAAIRTILRRSKYIKARPVLPEHRPYQLSLAEAAQESDMYLARKGPPSYEFPYHRDNYYNLEAYVPNRKWSHDEGRWKYYAGTQHERDLEWVRDRFGVEEDGERVARRMAELEDRLRRSGVGR
jgi:uncharacterized protein YceK